MLLFSFQNSSTWKPIGPNITPMPAKDFKGWSANGIGRVFDLTTDAKDRRKIWVCSPNGGLFYSKNRGKKWQNIPLPVSGGAIQIERIPIEKNRCRIYVASNVSMANRDAYSYGIYASDNNGKSWDTIHKLVPAEYKLATIGSMKWFNQRLIYTINDSVFSFQNGKRILLTWCNSEISDIVAHPTLPNQWYLCGKNIWVTKDDGRTFKTIQVNDDQVFKAKRCDLAFDSKSNGVVVAHEVKGNYQYKLQGDQLITRRRMNISIDIHRTQIVYDVERSQFIIGGLRLYAMKGADLSQISFPNYPNPQFMHDDIRAIHFDDHSNILIGHDGGISISENGGQKWFNINGCGLNISEIYDFDMNDEVLIAGAQDLSSFKIQKKTKEWTHFSSLYSDGGSCLINRDTWYVMKSLRLVNTQNEGIHFNYPHVPARIARFNPKISSINNHMYLGGKHLWKKTNTGWLDLSPKIESTYDITGLVIQDNFMLLSKTDPVWRSKNLAGKLYRSLNGGRSWQDITSQFPAYAYRQIADMCATTNLSHIYACIGSFDNPKGDQNKVFVSTDKGDTWKDLSVNLPNVPCTCIALIPNVGLLLGTDKGLFIFKNNQWQRFGKELPETPITRVRMRNNRLYVSTYGRGIWVLK